MADENTPETAPEGQQTPPATPAQPVTTPPTVVNNTGGFSQAQVDSFVAAERRRLQDSDDAKAGKAAVSELAKLKAAQMSETERLTAEKQAAEKLAEERAVKYRDALIRSKFMSEAVTKGVPADRIDAAFRLADMSGVSVDEATDNVTGIEAAVKSLPEFVLVTSNGKPPMPNINGGGGIEQKATHEQKVQTALTELRRRGGDL